MTFASAAVPTKLLLSAGLAALSLPSLHAEPHCPGNAAILPFRLVLGSEIIAPVLINHLGPYNFLVDTGSQVTTLEPSLAFELHLKTQGKVGIIGVGSSRKAQLTQIDLLEAGSQGVANSVVGVSGLQDLQAAGLPIRGILGQDFLGHFDLLMDYTQKILCLDGMKVMRGQVNGVRVELISPVPAADGVPSTGLLLIPVHLSRAGTRQLLLALDSAAQMLLLYDPGQDPDPEVPGSRVVEAQGGAGGKRAIAVLPPQKMQIGSLSFQEISVTVPSGLWESPRVSQVDGLLPTVLFRRVFISSADHFAILDTQRGSRRKPD
jgi:hypothetical protein